MHVPHRRGWELPESAATSEAAALDRRAFLARVGLAAAGLAVARTWAGQRPASLTVTDEREAARFTPYHEFHERKEEVWGAVAAFEPRPWRIEITGLVENPRRLDVDELIRLMPRQERIYRHRCAAGWAMVAPWTGFPMRDLVKWARPLSSARFVRMVSFQRPDQAPRQRGGSSRWPHEDALRLDEAMHELAFIAHGIYGHDLPAQHGAPIRLVLPWKYGFKSLKGVLRFEFTDLRDVTSSVALRQPVGSARDFLSNVGPGTEWMIGTGERVPTRPFNGYGEWVAKLYERDSAGSTPICASSA